MKKNLMFSISMLLLALLTLCGVTFAYFSSSGGGGDQTLTLDNYEFTVSATAVQTVSPVSFKAPTIINFPRISAPVFDHAAYDVMTEAEKAAYRLDYDAKLNLYRRRGDDDLFDDFCFPLMVSSVNKSMATMRFDYKVVSAAVGAINASSALRYFVFDKAYTARLKSGGVNAGQYAAALHELCDAADAGALTDPEAVTERRLITARETSLGSLASDVYYTGQTAETLIVCWLDYTEVRRIIYEINGGVDMGRPDDNAVGAYRSFPLKLSVSVTAENTPWEGGGA